MSDAFWMGLFSLAFWMGLFSLVIFFLKKWFVDRRRNAELSRDVRTIEKATNSMKDAMVKATGDKRYLEGKDDGRRDSETKP